MRAGRHRAGRVVVGLLAGLALIAPARAAAVTPVAECLEPTATPGVFNVYYGYVNTGTPQQIDFGSENQVLPGFGVQGQPTIFNVGSYPRVFKAVFNSNVFTANAWSLDGTDAVATAATPLCASGATGPASDVSTTGATLHGLVDSMSVETTWSFEYGETIGYGQSTPDRLLTNASPQLVSEVLAGLEPGTTYHYRLLSDGPSSTVGEDRTFTTDPLPPPPEPEAATPPRFDLAAAVKRCKRKFRQGSKGRKRCIQRAKRLASWA